MPAISPQFARCDLDSGFLKPVDDPGISNTGLCEHVFVVRPDKPEWSEG